MAVVGDLQEAVRNGKPLSEGLAMHRDLFPPSLRAMVLTGENAGELATMLDSVASSIDAEIDALIGGLSAKIEVALLLIMGVVVGALLAVLYLPILNLATTVGSGISDGEF
jgi:type IV pilus assembly protein PilC